MKHFIFILANTHTPTDAQNLKTLAVILICIVIGCAWLGSLIDKIPEGWQNENRFHKGKQPIKKIYTTHDEDDWHELDVEEHFKKSK